MLRRAQEGSQTFLTAIILMVASERRMVADWFTRALMEGFAQRCKSKASRAIFDGAVPVAPAGGLRCARGAAGWRHVHLYRWNPLEPG